MSDVEKRDEKPSLMTGELQWASTVGGLQAPYMSLAKVTNI